MAQMELRRDQSEQPAEPVTESVLRQRTGTLLSPEAQHVLDLRYHPEHNALVIGCLGVPCWLQLAPEGSGVWAFGCPWWQSLISEDNLFETRVLAEVAKAKMHMDGMLEKMDLSRVN